MKRISNVSMRWKTTRRDIISVSYTHLDVYKRQGERLRVGLHEGFEPLAQGFGPGVEGLNVRLDGGILLFADGQTARCV